MYYNIHNQTIINYMPSSVTLDNGTVITGENLDSSILAEGGFYTVRTDVPTQPENTIENVSQRVVNIDKPYVDINRTWTPAPVIIPENISARQVRLWLIDNNIDLNNVVNIIDTIQDPILKQKTLVEWEYAPYIERNHPLIDALGSALGLTSEQIDQGFITASQL
jgi:hypothetical protein